MKSFRPALAGLVLLLVAIVLVFAGRSCSDEAEVQATSGTRTPGQGQEPPTQATKRSLPQRRGGPDALPPKAAELQLLWARGRESELLPALDRIAAQEDPDDWRAVADILVEQAATEGRHDVISYLLSVGHGAPAGLRLEIYAAALDNPDEIARDTARLELLNLSGRSFDSAEQARSWIASNPAASREEEPAGE
jgi:hypothetical protein